MSNELFNVEAYLKRINYEGKIDVSYETLYGIHVAHTLNVPFENLSIYYNEPISLERDSLYKKIVEKRRGGYCFEMNGFFSFVLKELGFKVKDLLARGTMDGITYFAKLHQILVVEVDDRRYLADVGFGNDGITAPLLLDTQEDQKQFAHTYRLIEDPKHGYILQKKEGENYNYMYAFTLDECYPMDFIVSNHFTETFPDSFFKKMKMCTMPTKEGRITLTDKQFKVISDGKVSEREIDDIEYEKLLKEHFKLNLQDIAR